MHGATPKSPQSLTTTSNNSQFVIQQIYHVITFHYNDTITCINSTNKQDDIFMCDYCILLCSVMNYAVNVLMTSGSSRAGNLVFSKPPNRSP